MRRACEIMGSDYQYLLLIEEMNELELEILRFFRKSKDIRHDALVEEIADVELMLGQLKYMENISEEELDEIKNIKLSRLQKKLNTGIEISGETVQNREGR